MRPSPGLSRPRPQTLLTTAVLLLALAAPSAHAAAGRFSPIGPDGGDVRAVRVDPADPRVVYAAARLAGVFKSTDGGVSWARLAGTAPRDDHQPVLDLAIDPSAPGTLYVARGATVLKSRDGGATFADAGGELRFHVSNVQALAIDPTVPAVLYAAAYRGIYKTYDGGGSWRPAGSELAELDVSSVAVDPRAPQTVFAGVEDSDQGGVFKSTDGGASWERKTAGLPPRSFGEGAVRVEVDPQAAGRVFAVYASLNPNSDKIPRSFRSTDSGETWREMAGAAGGYPLVAGPGGFVQAGGRRSTDGGLTWSAARVPGLPLSSLAVDPRWPATVYAGSGDRGVAKSTDAGRSWASASRGLQATQVTGLAVDPKGPGVLYAGVVGERLWARSLAGGRFELQSSSSSAGFPVSFSVLRPDPSVPRRLYGFAHDTLVRSGDGGRSFAALAPPNRDSPCFKDLDLAVDPDDPDVLYAGGAPQADRCDPGCDTFKSTDAGASWRCMDLDRLSRIYAHPTRPGVVFAVSDFGFHRSTDAGESWRNLRPNHSNDAFISLAFDPRHSKALYAGALQDGDGREGVWRSTDDGATWVPWSRGFRLPVTELLVDPRNPAILYAAVSRVYAFPRETAGVYRSADGGRTWAKIPGLPGLLFDGLLALDARRGTLYAGTIGQGVYAATVPAR